MLSLLAASVNGPHGKILGHERERLNTRPTSKEPVGLGSLFQVPRVHIPPFCLLRRLGNYTKLSATSWGAGPYAAGSIEQVARPWLKPRMALE